MAKNNPYTEEERTVIVSMLKQGKSSAEISALFDRPRNSISRLAKNLKIPLNIYWTKWEIGKAKQLREEGMTAQQIADVLERTYSSVKSHLRRAGAHRKTTPPGPDYVQVNPFTPTTDIYVLWCRAMDRVSNQK